MLEDGKEVEIKLLPSIVNIAYFSRVTRSGRVFAQAPQKVVDDRKS